MKEPEEQMVTCTVCQSEFDLIGEGGISGTMGICETNFCPWCLSSMLDMMRQLHLMPALLKKAWRTARGMKKGEREKN